MVSGVGFVAAGHGCVVEHCEDVPSVCQGMKSSGKGGEDGMGWSLLDSRKGQI